MRTELELEQRIPEFDVREMWRFSKKLGRWFVVSVWFDGSRGVVCFFWAVASAIGLMERERLANVLHTNNSVIANNRKYSRNVPHPFFRRRQAIWFHRQRGVPQQQELVYFVSPCHERKQLAK